MSDIADSAGFVEDNSDDGVGHVLSISVGCFSNNWILDTGCSYHMCPNRDWFSTYQSIDGGFVLMGNDISCQVVGVGSVQVRMYDGIVRTLTNVRHVPDLKKNLISLSTLDSLDYEYSAAGGVLRVCKDGGIVILGNLSNGLYVVQGETVICDDYVSSLPELDDVDDLLRELWVSCCEGNFCNIEDIVKHRTIWKSPQFGIAECVKKTLLEKVYCLLSHFGWSLDFSYACFGSPSTAFGLKTLLEVWFCCPANYLDILGCSVDAHVIDGKHDGKAEKFGFHGFEFGVNEYGLWCVEPHSLKFIVSRDVIFDVHAMRFVDFESIGAGLDHGVCKQVELGKALGKFVWILEHMLNVPYVSAMVCTQTLEDTAFVGFVCCKFKCSLDLFGTCSL